MDIENNKEFFLVVCGGVDEATTVDWDGNIGFQSKEDALEHAKCEASNGGSFTMFRCIPIECVERGPVRVKSIAVKKP